MTHKRQLIDDNRPAYSDGQLLRENDFVDEQTFHVRSRQRQNRRLHGVGVAEGLEVKLVGDNAISVSPGFALDREGRELLLRTSETLDLQGLAAGSTVKVWLGYRSSGSEARRNRHADYAEVHVGKPEPADITLASVTLEADSHACTLSTEGRDRLFARPNSVRADSLAPELRRNWVTFAFHPTRIPEDQKDSRPPYRIGATRALAHREYRDTPNDKGAGGTMAVMLPPGVRAIHSFRIAGDGNAGTITAVLVRGGIVERSPPGEKRKGSKGSKAEERTYEHKRHVICKLEIRHPWFVEPLDPRASKLPMDPKDEVSYLASGKVEEADTDFNNPAHADFPNDTLAVEVRSTAYSSVSLVAVEVSY